jgi:hypothetical protein
MRSLVSKWLTFFLVTGGEERKQMEKKMLSCCVKKNFTGSIASEPDQRKGVNKRKWSCLQTEQLECDLVCFPKCQFGMIHVFGYVVHQLLTSSIASLFAISPFCP